jgi:hypothetical protein
MPAKPLPLFAALAAVLAGGLLVGGQLVPAASAEPGRPTRAAGWAPRVGPLPSASAGPAPAPRRSAPPPVTFPAEGRGRYLTVPGIGPVLGHAGQIMRFRIAIERDISGLDVDAFVAFVEQTYADPRGWTAGGDWRFRRVGPGGPADFTLYLVTPATRDRLCGGGYDRFTSCRNGAKVILNVARWVRGVRHYGAQLETYRRYMVNHETGHRLGHGHERCPGRGEAAPVMQQQTLGLRGCRANPWPYGR